MLGQLLDLSGLGQVIAPDPIVAKIKEGKEEQEEQNDTEENKQEPNKHKRRPSTTSSSPRSTGFWGMVAPDPVYYSTIESGATINRCSACGSTPQDKNSNSNQNNFKNAGKPPSHPDLASSVGFNTPPPSPFPSGRPPLPQTLGTNMASHYSHQTPERRRSYSNGSASSLADFVMEAAQGTALSMSSPTPVWEANKDFFLLCASTKPLNDAKIKKLKKKLKKDPTVVNSRASNLNTLVPDGFTPLHAAAHSGNLEAAKVLIEFAVESSENDKDDTVRGGKRVSVKTTDLQGRTPLHIAAGRGHVELVSLLKEALANEQGGLLPVGELAPIDLTGRTPIAWAATSREASARKNMARLEKELFSPGDASICGRTPVSDRLGGGKSTGRRKGNQPREIGIAEEEVEGEEDDSDVEYRNLDLNYGFSEMNGWRVEMEDAICCHYPIPGTNEQAQEGMDMGLFGVFDGHGDGGLASQFVAENLPKCLVESQDWKDGDLSDVVTIQKALLSACLEVDELLKQEKHIRNGGTTGVIAVVTRLHVIVANVGDSRAIIVQQKDKSASPQTENETEQEKQDAPQDQHQPEDKLKLVDAIAMSEDHKPNLPAERERIEASGLVVLPETYREPDAEEYTTTWKVMLVKNGREDRIAVSRAFGDFDYKSNSDLASTEQALVAIPEIKVHERNSSDSLLVLACDGIWDVMTNNDVADFMAEKCNHESSPEDIVSSCDGLLSRCLEKNSRDNMTVITVTLPPPVRSFGTALNFDNVEE